jgi:hypothetical protein
MLSLAAACLKILTNDTVSTPYRQKIQIVARAPAEPGRAEIAILGVIFVMLTIDRR